MPGEDTSLLDVSGLRVRVPGRVLVEALDMTLARGEMPDSVTR